MKYKKIPLVKNKFKKIRKVKLQWYHFVFPIIIFLIILIQIKLRLFQKNSFFIKNEPFKMRKKLPDYNFTDIIENYFMKLPKKFRGERDHELRLFKGSDKQSSQVFAPLGTYCPASHFKYCCSCFSAFLSVAATKKHFFNDFLFIP